MEQILKFDEKKDSLIEAVLAGNKRAILSVYDGEALPKIGEQFVLTYENEKEACRIVIRSVCVLAFCKITEAMARMDGKEKDRQFADWKREKFRIFKTQWEDFDESTAVRWIFFEVMENLVLNRLRLAERIVEENKDLFGNAACVREINAGFNNSVFSVNDEFVLKICQDPEKEETFEREALFYRSNQENGMIPHLFRYSKDKTRIPAVYEIMEKIRGKTVYYYWYRMSEAEREGFICRLMEAVKTIHAGKKQGYDWALAVREGIMGGYKKTEDAFSQQEKSKIEKVLEICNEVLTDNQFARIHNDLHFDNILLDDENRVWLIDFNDTIVAPFDFDLRQLYMTVEMPKNWANIEMDQYQKKEDYRNLFYYVKKYYPELTRLNDWEERMILYSIWNDFELFPRFKNERMKKRILDNVYKIEERFR